MHRHTSTFLALAVGKVVLALSALAITVVVGRVLGPEGLGQWALLGAASAFLHTTFVNWTHGGTIRFGCEEWVATGSMRRTVSARVPLVLAGGGIALLVLWLQPMGWLHRFFGLGRSEAWLVAAYAASLWVTAEAQATLQALERIREQAVVGMVAGLGSLAAVYALVTLGRGDLWSIALAVSGTVGAVWGVAWGAALVHARVRLGRPSSESLGEQVRYGIPQLLAFAVGYLGTWGGYVLLQRLTTVEQVGQFGLSYQVFMSIVAANSMLTTLVLPRLVASRVQNPTVERRYVEHVVPTIFVLWTFAMAAIVAVLPSMLLLVAGEKFRPAVTPLLVLCVVLPSSVVTNLYTALFSVQQRLGRLFLYTCVTVTLNLTLAFALIPRFGAVGAAVGTVAAHVVSEFVYLTDQHRRLGVSAVPVLAVWVVVLILGLVQGGLETHVLWRIVWAAAAVLLVGAVARRTAAVDGALVDTLFAGLLWPVGSLLRRALVKPAA